MNKNRAVELAAMAGGVTMFLSSTGARPTETQLAIPPTLTPVPIEVSPTMIPSDQLPIAVRNFCKDITVRGPRNCDVALKDNGR